MKTAFHCIPCFVRQAAEAIAFCVPEEERRIDLMRRLLAEIAGYEWHTTPVAVSQRMHRFIRLATGSSDPYQALKERSNRLALELLPEFHKTACQEEDPQAAFAHLALAGNLIDAGAKGGLAESDIRSALCHACLERPSGPAAKLFEAAGQARQILYLADNAGEIVFDRPLIEALSPAKTIVAVRGSPVINDATMADAEAAGLPEIVRVISNGSDAPGTLLDGCSEEFRRTFEHSDLIVAKGQGNYESLSTASKRIFFLLRIKCLNVSRHIGTPLDRMVILQHTP